MDKVKDSLELNDSLTLILKIVDLINFEWNLHFLVVVTLTGWLISLQRNPVWQLKLLLTLGVLGFALVNIWTLVSYYSMLDILLQELKASVNETTFKGANTLTGVNGLSLEGYRRIIFMVHAPIDSALLFGLWSNSVWRKIRQSAPPEHGASRLKRSLIKTSIRRKEK